MSGSSKLFEDEEAIEDDQDDDFPEQGMITFVQNDQSTMMDAASKEMIQRAIKRSLDGEAAKEVEELVNDYRDVFRLELGRDPPADVATLKIELIDEDLAERKLPRARRFAPLQQNFLDIGIVTKNRSGYRLRCAFSSSYCACE